MRVSYGSHILSLISVARFRIMNNNLHRRVLMRHQSQIYSMPCSDTKFVTIDKYLLDVTGVIVLGED